MKKIALRIVILFGAVLLHGCGTFNETKELIQSSKINDPPVDTFNAVYRKGNVIAVDYSVRNPQHEKQVKKSDAYWAELKMSRLSYNLNYSGVTLHREPTPNRIKRNWEKLPIQRLKHIDFYDIARRPTSDIPDVFYRGDNWLYIRYAPENGAYIKNFCPHGSYIPLQNYPKIIALLPIAIVTDVITFPAQWLGWMMWKDVH